MTVFRILGLLTLSLLSLVPTLSLALEGSSPEVLQCGRYNLKGLLVKAKGTAYVFELYPETTRHYQLILEDETLAAAGSALGKRVEILAVITHPGRGKGARGVVLQVLRSITQHSTLDSPVRLIAPAACKP